MASVDHADGDEAERLLNPGAVDFIVSDEDWRTLHYQRRLRHLGAPLSTFQYRVDRIR